MTDVQLLALPCPPNSLTITDSTPDGTELLGAETQTENFQGMGWTLSQALLKTALCVVDVLIGRPILFKNVFCFETRQPMICISLSEQTLCCFRRKSKNEEAENIISIKGFSNYLTLTDDYKC